MTVGAQEAGCAPARVTSAARCRGRRRNANFPPRFSRPHALHRSPMPTPAVTAESIADTLETLVSIPSLTGNEEAIADHITQRLAARAIGETLCRGNVDVVDITGRRVDAVLIAPGEGIRAAMWEWRSTGIRPGVYLARLRSRPTETIRFVLLD